MVGLAIIGGLLILLVGGTLFLLRKASAEIHQALNNAFNTPPKDR